MFNGYPVGVQRESKFDRFGDVAVLQTDVDGEFHGPFGVVIVQVSEVSHPVGKACFFTEKGCPFIPITFARDNRELPGLQSSEFHRVTEGILYSRTNPLKPRHPALLVGEKI